MSKALFLDLDGTIIETKSGETFPKDITDWKFKKGILNKIKEYVEDNYRIIIVTNQGGIDEGYITPTEISYKLSSITKQIEFYCLNFYDLIKMKEVKYYISPSLNCPNRKPSPNFAFQAKKEYDLDLSQCIMVGDASGLEREVLEKLNENILSKFFSDDTRLITDTVIINKKTYRLLPAKEDEEFNIELNNHNILARPKINSRPERHKYRFVSIKKDHSDSDKMFAENAGMKYIDIEEFLKD